MLYSEKYITKLPHKKDFDAWRKNISDSDYAAIEDALIEKACSSEVITSSWIPGNDWSGTVYEPIYNACGKNKEASGLFFGLILFNTLMNYPDTTWGFSKHGEIKEKDIKGTTYFILKNPPKN